MLVRILLSYWNVRFAAGSTVQTGRWWWKSKNVLTLDLPDAMRKNQTTHPAAFIPYFSPVLCPCGFIYKNLKKWLTKPKIKKIYKIAIFFSPMFVIWRRWILEQTTILFLEMWWLIGSAPDLWGRGPGFESGISHNDPAALQDHCVMCNTVNFRIERGTYPWGKQKYIKN